jgi:hypothetical protein
MTAAGHRDPVPPGAREEYEVVLAQRLAELLVAAYLRQLAGGKGASLGGRP